MERRAAGARICRHVVKADDPFALVSSVDEERAELRFGEPGRGFGDRFDQLVGVQLAGECGADPRERSTDVHLLPQNRLCPFSIGDVGDADQHAVERSIRRGKRRVHDDIEPASVQGLHARFRLEVPLAA